MVAGALQLLLRGEFHLDAKEDKDETKEDLTADKASSNSYPESVV